MKLSVRMPAYNEIGTIAEIVKLVAAALPGIEKELVIVDDGSRDGTRDWLTKHFGPVPTESELLAGCPRPISAIEFSDKLTVRAVFHDKNKGKGGAIRTAMKICSGDNIVIQDADLEYDPSDCRLCMNSSAFVRSGCRLRVTFLRQPAPVAILPSLPRQQGYLHFVQRAI